jgi:hypothetical protein
VLLTTFWTEDEFLEKGAQEMITMREAQAIRNGDKALLNKAAIQRAQEAGETLAQARRRLSDAITFEGRDVRPGEKMPATNVTLAQFKSRNPADAAAIDRLVRRRLLRAPDSSYEEQRRAILAQLQRAEADSPATTPGAGTGACQECSCEEFVGDTDRCERDGCQHVKERHDDKQQPGVSGRGRIIRSAMGR